jgi:hypothetical protein
MTTRFISQQGFDSFEERGRLIAERLATHQRQLQACSRFTRWLLRRKIIREADKELFGKLY